MQRLCLALILSVLSAAGCSGGGGGSSPRSSAPASTTTPGANPQTQTTGTTPAPEPRWWKGDLHVHTLHSGDAVDSVAQTLAMARMKGLDYIVLSDHRTHTQGSDPDFLSGNGLEVILGVEWTDVAHAGVINTQTVPSGLELVPDVRTWRSEIQSRIDTAHAEGGAVVLNHPTWHLFPWIVPVTGFDGIEVWNSFWTIQDIGLHPSTARTLADRLVAKGFTAAGLVPPPEIVRATARTGSANDQALFYWEEFLEQGKRVAAVGGSDRHKLFLPGYPTTWILAQDASAAAVTAAIREGRTMITAGPAGPRITFQADGDGDGTFESTIGDTLPAGNVANLRVRVEGARGGKMRLVKRRQVILEQRIDQDDYIALHTDATRAGDWYRVDILQPVDWSIPQAGQVVSMVTAIGGTSPGAITTLLTAFGVGIAVGANSPVLDFEERYLRLLNLDITGASLDWSRAAITSAILVR